MVKRPGSFQGFLNIAANVFRSDVLLELSLLH